MTGRRTDTRERIQKVALELFSEHGYDQTSLREIAEQLGVTKAALYYHFRTKEAILASIVEDLAEAIDDVIAWASDKPPTVETRQEILRRLQGIVGGRWRDVIRFGQANQAALHGRQVGEELGSRMVAVLGLVVDPASPLPDQIRSALALIAVYLGNLPPVAGMPVFIGPSATEEERAAAALEVGLALIAQAS